MEIMDRRYFVYIILDNSLIYLEMVIDIIPNISTLNRLIKGGLHLSFKDTLNQLCISEYL